MNYVRCDMRDMKMFKSDIADIVFVQVKEHRSVPSESGSHLYDFRVS